MRHLTKRLIGALIATVLLSTLASCSGSSASAPPVDLPAPITGRVTISNPDADGNVTITGTAGAVDAGAMVMAVNEEVAGTVAIKLLNMMIRSAYAQTSFPSVCDETGHACAVADDEGAFEMILAAELGDSIVIGVIDETTGEFISDLLRLIVGDQNASSDSSETTCADYDVDGKTVDIAIDPVSEEPILLRQGNSTGTNKLVIGTSSSYTITIDGCFAHSIDMMATTAGKTLIVVSSKDDGYVWTGTLDDAVVSDTVAFELDDEPMHVKFKPGSTTPVVALKTSSSVKIAQISLDDGTISNQTDIVRYNDNNDSTTISGLTRSMSLDMIQFENNAGQSLGLLLSDNGDPQEAYLSIFNPSNLEIMQSFAPADFDPFGLNQAPSSPIDAKFYLGIYAFENMPIVYIGLIDSFHDGVFRARMTAEGQFLFYEWNIHLKPEFNWSADVDNLAKALNTNGDSMPIVKFDVKPAAPGSVNTTYVAATSDGYVWKYVFGQPNPSSASDVASGNSFVAIALNNSIEKAFVADATEDESVSIGNLVWQ